MKLFAVLLLLVSTSAFGLNLNCSDRVPTESGLNSELNLDIELTIRSNFNAPNQFYWSSNGKILISANSGIRISNGEAFIYQTLGMHIVEINPTVSSEPLLSSSFDGTKSVFELDLPEVGSNVYMQVDSSEAEDSYALYFNTKFGAKRVECSVL